MGLPVFPVQLSPAGGFPVPDKERQVVLIDPLILIIAVIPYEAAVSAVLRDRLLPEYLPVFIICVKIKNKYPARVKIIAAPPAP